MKGKKAGFYFVKCIEWTLILLLILIVALVLLEVFFRYVLKLSLRGVEEVSRLVFVWACFIGISYCTVRQRQIKVEMLTKRLPPRILSRINLANNIIVCIVSLVMVIVGWQFVISRWTYPDYTTTLLYPRSLFWLPIPISGVIIFIYTLKMLILQFRHPIGALNQVCRGEK